MFTEGLDESAINWIKQGSDVEKPQFRSPLSEKYDKKYPIPRSPLGFSSASSHVLPPLKFHSGLLGTHNPVALSLDSSEDNYGDDDGDDSYDENDGDSESVASVPDELDGCCPGEEEELNEAIPLGSNDQMPGKRTGAVLSQIRGTGSVGARNGPKLNRGLSKEYLRIKVPENTRRYTDTELRIERCQQGSAAANGSSRLPEMFQPHSAYATPLGKFSDVPDLGTPSAPPLIEIRPEGQSSEAGSACSANSSVMLGFAEANELPNMSRESVQEVPGAKDDQNEQSYTSEVKEKEDSYGSTPGEATTTMGSCEAKPKGYSPYYDASDQNAWQSLIAYDACIRLCLNAWARGCPEAPEFLRDECLLLRSAFGLHKFLLQPHSMQSTERTRKKIEHTLPFKGKQFAGKIRLEVKKLRIITKWKLKDTNSMQGAMYMQVGAEYVRHVSSLVKSGINSLKRASSSLTSEESFSCLVQLKSSVEDNQDGLSSSISLHPGTGDYHDFFPENQGDSVLIEVQDMKKNVQGQAAIPVSSLTDYPAEKVRWWPIYHDDHECIGKVQPSISWTFTNDELTHIKNGPIVETFAYDLLLEAAMRGNGC